MAQLLLIALLKAGIIQNTDIAVMFVPFWITFVPLCAIGFLCFIALLVNLASCCCKFTAINKEEFGAVLLLNFICLGGIGLTALFVVHYQEHLKAGSLRMQRNLFIVEGASVAFLAIGSILLMRFRLKLK